MPRPPPTPTPFPYTTLFRSGWSRLHSPMPQLSFQTLTTRRRRSPRRVARPFLGAREDDSADDVRLDQAKKVGDRKSTRLNSSHLVISYAVFCLKKKKNEKQ